MAHFDEVFPRRIGFGTVAQYEEGSETFRAVSRRSVTTKYLSQFYRTFNVATAIHTEADFQEFLNFYKAIGGPGNTFLFQDPWDFTTAALGAVVDDEDVVLESSAANGQTDFQLIKPYASGTISSNIDVFYPDASTVVVAKDSVAQTLTTDYTIEAGGIIRFVVAMTGGEEISAGFEYYLKAEFGSTTFPVRAPTRQASGDFFLQGSGSIPIFEVPY